ncbi:cupin domain-containing protein [Mycoplasmopsis lipofaciens]|uniref:hypothetical protein n=1 Tax=Mycoplasmopsis lipofaciens TaxID=114884 RepID=UPI000691250A|nr:hypothetical protein [Mycoplasmopsis lipofaciens]
MYSKDEQKEITVIKQNLFEYSKVQKNKEDIKKIFNNKYGKIELIYSNEITSDWIRNEDIEICFLINGEAIIQDKNNNLINLNKGDVIYISKDLKHKIVSTSNDAIWIACHFESE